MGYILKIMVLSMVVAIGTSTSDYLCNYSGSSSLQCTGQGLTLPPPGYWPQITYLTLEDNPIADLPKSSLSGFPGLNFLDIDKALLTKLDFGELAIMPNLFHLSIQNNRIDTFIAPPNGVTLEKLQFIFSNTNKISKLDPNLFLFAPNLNTLAINFNPLVVEAGQPILNHPKLDTLYVGIGSSSFNVVTSEHLSGLPNLSWVTIRQAQVTSVTGAFVNNKLLRRIDLSLNKITQITSGTFASEGVLETLLLEGNPLNRLDTAAVNKPMAGSGTISIKNTPLACDCGFEALFWWASGKNITINAACDGQDECSFTRRLRRFASPLSPKTETDVLGFYGESH